jgi:hypothetical protein
MGQCGKLDKDGKSKGENIGPAGHYDRLVAGEEFET